MADKQSKKEIMLQKLAERQGEAKTVRKIVMMAAVAVIALVLIIGAGSFFYVTSALKPYDEDNTEKREVEIPIGSSTSTIAKILEENEIIKSARIFKYYIKFNNESNFQAGKYQLSQSMKLEEIVREIQSGKLVNEADIKMTIPEGKQLYEIAEIIAKNTGGEGEKILTEMNSPEFVEKMKQQYPELLTDEIMADNVKYPLEGYLYPATYEFYEDKPSLESIVGSMIAQTSKVLANYESLMKEKGFTYHELLTMASMIEREATAQTDRGKIASVFYNRLEIGMPLQTDPTVLYAMGTHKERVLLADLKTKDPYNTYYVNGMPPGPIANAGETSIKAALEPEKTDYLYFLANAEGKVFYSKTLAEHNKLKEEHITSRYEAEEKKES